MNLEEQYHAEGMLRKIERVEAERDNAWAELREIREAISANPEESTLDEVVTLRQQLAEALEERDLAEDAFKTTRDRCNDAVEKLAEAQAEALEQARIVGMGGEREIALRQQVALLRKGFTDILTNTCDKFPGQRMLQIMGICNDALVATEPITNITYASALAARQNDGILLPFPYGDGSTRRRNADDLRQYTLCEKDPVVWMQSDHLSKFIHHACGAQAALVRCSDHQLMPDFQPLYRARSTK